MLIYNIVNYTIFFKEIYGLQYKKFNSICWGVVKSFTNPTPKRL